MPETRDQLVAFLEARTAAGVRERLLARGMARGMIWRAGSLPEGAQTFSPSLSTDLLDHGYGILGKALALRGMDRSSVLLDDSFRVAAESIEAAVRNGYRDEARDFHLVVAAVAFHLARFPARSFCLAPDALAGPNLSTSERLLVGIMRRELRVVREICARWLRDPQWRDEAVAGRLQAPNLEFGVEDAEIIAMTRSFVRATAACLSGLESGSAPTIETARARFDLVAVAALERRYVPQWWGSSLARELVDDLWANSLQVLLPIAVDGEGPRPWAELRTQFINVLYNRTHAQVDLWPSQVPAAIRAMNPDDDLVVALPTSAGKTRIAELCILRCLAQGKRVIYVTPLRALSAQLERTLAQTFRPLGISVTSLYGASGIAQADIATIQDGQIVVATPEKLDFAIRIAPEVLDDVGLVVLDEGHMIGLGTRELRYEVLVQRLLGRSDAGGRRIVCLSAIFAEGETFDDFTAWIRSDEVGGPISSDWRPTRQRVGTVTWGDAGGRLALAVEGENPFVPRFVQSERPSGKRKRTFPNSDEELVVATAKAFLTDKHRVLVYCPQRRSVERMADVFLTAHRQGFFPSILAADGSIERALRVGREWLGDDHVALKALRLGIGVHHGLLPRAFQSEVEDLLNRKALPVVIASPTVAQGLDLSCSVLVFRSIFRYRDQTINAAEFANVRGRAGRAYVDLDGITVYPIFERGRTRGFRLRAFQRLIDDSEGRALESGIVLLIDELARVIARQLGVELGALLEYVVNQRFDWDTLGTVSSDADNTNEGDQGEREEEAASVDAVISALDTVILGTIGEQAIELDQVGEALDAALRSSLWARRIARRDSTGQALSNALLRERARLIWRRTELDQRRAYYGAGVGLSAGRYLDEEAARLIALLGTCEDAILRGEVQSTLDALYELVEVLSGVAPFKLEHRVANWRSLLSAWVSGANLSALSGGSAGVGFIQDDIVYRMVWGVEAARIHGVARGIHGAAELLGTLALVLTYGLPTMVGIALARAGLVSREMIMRLLNKFPDIFEGEPDIRSWVERLSERVDVAFWEKAVHADLWREFSNRWLDPRGGAWTQADADAQVAWLSEAAVPEPGSQVRLVHDSRDGVTYVCNDELETLGHLTLPLPVASRGSVAASVGGEGTLSLRLFVPRASA